MRTSLKKMTLALVALPLAAAACSNGSNGPAVGSNVTVPSPSAVASSISSGLAVAQQAFCGNVDEIQSTIAQLQASPATDTIQDAATSLASVATSLERNAQQLDAAGQTQLANLARNTATALQQLSVTISQNASNATAWQGALGLVGTILGQLPPGVCPSP